MVLWAFPEGQLRRLCIVDSSFDPAANGRSQHGWLVGYTTPGLAQSQTVPVSLVSWKSKKLRRKGNSSLLCEAQSANISVGHWLCVANLEMSLRYAAHRFGDNLVERRVESPTVLSLRTARVTDPDGLLVFDAKSLYDSLDSQQANQDDHRSALESSIVKEDLEKLGGAVRWIPHDKNHPTRSPKWKAPTALR